MTMRLLGLVLAQPQLLARHAQAYAELAAAEWAEAAAGLRRRALLQAMGGCGLALAVALAGVAVLLWAVTPPAQVHAPWALWAVPLLPAGLGVACLAAARRIGRAAAFLRVRRQWQADRAMLHEAGLL